MTYTIDHSKQSPNHSSRDGTQIRMLVMHATVGSGASALAWLCNPQPGNPKARVSTHYLIYKTGYIYQLVDDSEAAWHAGKSAWSGLDSEEIQLCSLGVELENTNSGHDPYPPIQFNAALMLCQDLVKRYAITPDMVTRHLDIAIPKGRKTDPAGFQWGAFVAALYAPVGRLYRVRAGLPVYEAVNRQGKLWGFLAPNEEVVIDDPANGHLEDGRGFVDTNGLVAL